MTSSTNRLVKTKTNDIYYQIHISRFKKLEKNIRALNLSPKSVVLDIGCFPPYLLNFLKKQGYDTHGICSQHEAIRGHQIKILDIDRDSLPYKDDSFDLIVMSEVLEHLIGNPVNIFSEIYRILKPGGHFLLTTPNVLRLQNIISLLIGKNIYFGLDQLNNSNQSLGTIYFRHNREYTQKELQILLKSSGFHQVINHYFISYLPNRAKNNSDPFYLKIIKYTNYLLMLIFPTRKDTIFVMAQK